jgi:hypothetical protein
MEKITLDLEFSKTTPGTVVYGRADRTGLPFSSLYVRKDEIRREGVKDEFPAKIRVTVEVLD